MDYRHPPVGPGGFSAPATSTQTGAAPRALPALPPLAVSGHSHNGSTSSLNGFAPRGGQEIVISEQDRQEGYDPDLLKLKPRGGANGRETVSPSPSNPSMITTADDPYRSRGDSLSSMRPSSFGSGNLLFPNSSYQESTDAFPVSYTTRPAVEAPADANADGREKHCRTARSAPGRNAAAKVHWWTSKLWLGVILAALLLFGAGVGLGIGLGMRHRQTSTAAVAASSQNSSATPNQASSRSGTASFTSSASLPSASTLESVAIPIQPSSYVVQASSGFATSTTSRHSKATTTSIATSTD